MQVILWIKEPSTLEVSYEHLVSFMTFIMCSPYLEGNKFSLYTSVQWKRNTYKSYYNFLTTHHFIFVIVSSCTVAFS